MGYIAVRHFDNAKQEKTRLLLIEKSVPQIIKGIGFNEKYRAK